MRRQYAVVVERPDSVPMVVGPYWRWATAVRVARRLRIERNETSMSKLIYPTKIRTMFEVLDNPPWRAG